MEGVCFVFLLYLFIYSFSSQNEKLMHSVLEIHENVWTEQVFEDQCIILYRCSGGTGGLNAKLVANNYRT